MERPRCALQRGIPLKGLERREVETMERAAAHGFRRLSVIIIRPAFEQGLTKMKTKFDISVNDRPCGGRGGPCGGTANTPQSADREKREGVGRLRIGMLS